MKLIHIFFLIFFLFACSKKIDEDLVDIKTYIKQGEKIDLFKNFDTLEKELLKIKAIKVNTNINIEDWKQSNFNSQNYIPASKIDLIKKKKIVSKKIDKIVFVKNIYIAIDTNSNLYFFNENFKILKKIQIYKKKLIKNYDLFFNMVIINDKVVISDNLGNVYAYNYKNYEKIWFANLSVPFVSDIKIYKNNIYLINTNSKLFSINSDSGKINWSYSSSSKKLKGKKTYRLAINKNLLFYTDDNAEIYCLNLDSNTILWSLKLQLENFINIPKIFEASPILIVNNILYFSTNYGLTYAIDTFTGRIIWYKKIISTNKLIYNNNKILLLSKNNFVILNSLNGEILFNKKIEKSQNKVKNFFDIALTKNNIYLFSSNGEIVTFKTKNLLLQKTNSPLSSFREYLILKNNFIIITNNNLEIF